VVAVVRGSAVFVGASVVAVVAVVSVVVGAVGAVASVDVVRLSASRAVVVAEDPRLHGATANAITASSARILTST
jgi:hypothetical protein